MIIDHAHFPMCFFLKICYPKIQGSIDPIVLLFFRAIPVLDGTGTCMLYVQTHPKIVGISWLLSMVRYILIFDASMCPSFYASLPHLSERKKWRIIMSYNHKQRARIVPIYGYNKLLYVMLCGSFKIQAFE